MQATSISTITNKNSYKYFTFLAVLYVTVLLLTLIIENRIVLFGKNIKILSGTLVLPLSYAISDIITEVYGYAQMKRLIWISIITLYISAGIIYIIIHLPSDNSNYAAYNTVFDPFTMDIFTYSIAAGISIFLNSYLLAKWKVLMHGKRFWLRSLGSTAIGEAIFIIIWALIGFSYKFPIVTLLGFMLVSYLYKIAYNLITIIPTTITTAFLKKAEKIDIYDYNLEFNP